MKASLARIAAVLWVIGLIVSLLLRSIPSGRAPVFLILAAVAAIPLVLGSRRLRIMGFTALVGSLLLAHWEYQEDRRLHPFRGLEPMTVTSGLQPATNSPAAKE